MILPDDDESSLTEKLLDDLDHVEFRVKDALTQEYIKVDHCDFAEDLSKYKKMIYEIVVITTPTHFNYPTIPDHIRSIVDRKAKRKQLPICHHCGKQIKYPYFYNVYGTPICRDCLVDFRDWSVLCDEDYKERET